MLAIAGRRRCMRLCGGLHRDWMQCQLACSDSERQIVAVTARVLNDGCNLFTNTVGRTYMASRCSLIAFSRPSLPVLRPSSSITTRLDGRLTVSLMSVGLSSSMSSRLWRAAAAATAIAGWHRW